MKLKMISMFFTLLVAVLLLTLPGIAAESESIYGHVTFIENQATIIRTDQAKHKAVVNLPLVPGDMIVTSADGRCELQFDNGTVIRLDKDSRLSITTVQAPTLTSRWKVTTLHLFQGQVYALPQTYSMEIFQIITPNAAVKLKSRTAATIGFNTNLSTTLFSDRGKFEVMYGADNKTQKTIKVKAGKAYIINSFNTLVLNSDKRNLEFVAWNEYVDRHFKELHYGISKVPPKLKLGSSVLQYWAEHFAPLYGEWIYDELFGYVWKPASEQFAHFDRPFYHADYVRVNGQLFLVPQETWAWVPAHMGTWVWLKRGWTWIPGNWFHSGVIEFFVRNECFFPNFYYYFWDTFGGFDLYKCYHGFGNEAWRENYYGKFHKNYNKPPLKDLPRELQKIVKRINKAPLNVLSERLNAGPLHSGLEAIKMSLPIVYRKAVFSDKRANRVPYASEKRVLSKSLNPDRVVSAKGKTKANIELKNLARRDWNPDRRWATEHGYSINYSSSRNAVLCPELNVFSDQKHFRNRAGLAESVFPGKGNIHGNSSQTGNNRATEDRSATKSAITGNSSDKSNDSKK